MKAKTQHGEFEVRELTVKDRRRLALLFTACHQHQDAQDGARLAAMCEEALALYGVLEEDIAHLSMIEQAGLAQELVLKAIGGDGPN